MTKSEERILDKTYKAGYSKGRQDLKDTLLEELSEMVNTTSSISQRASLKMIIDKINSL